MRLPLAGMALMFVLGVIAVDMNFDAEVTANPLAPLTYYKVQQSAPPPSSLLIPIAIVAACSDTLYSLFVLRDVRELGFLVLGSYVLYLFVGIIIPSLKIVIDADAACEIYVGHNHCLVPGRRHRPSGLYNTSDGSCCK